VKRKKICLKNVPFSGNRGRKGRREYERKGDGLGEGG
jgi:hypothetical protein